MNEEFNTDVVPLEELDTDVPEDIPKIEIPGTDAQPFDAATMDLKEYALEPHMSIGEPSSGDIMTAIPEDTLDAGLETTSDTDGATDGVMDIIPEDTSELTESQMARLADLDEGYAAVAKEGQDIMDSILSDGTTGRSEKIAALKNLRAYEAAQADDYHAFKQEIIDNPDDSGQVVRKTIHR